MADKSWRDDDPANTGQDFRLRGCGATLSVGALMSVARELLVIVAPLRLTLWVLVALVTGEVLSATALLIEEIGFATAPKTSHD